MIGWLISDNRRLSVAERGLWRSHKFWLLRRISQVSVLGLFVLGPWFGIWIVRGNFGASDIFGLHLADPYVVLQGIAGGAWPAWPALTGALIVAAAYFLLGGRVYCAWVCPVNVVTDTAYWLREKTGLTRDRKLDRRARLMILAATFVASAVTGTVAWEFVNPVSLLQRAFIEEEGIVLRRSVDVAHIEMAFLVEVARCLFLPLAPFRARRRRSVLAPDVLHVAHPLLLQDALDALDGISLAVEEMADAAQEVDIVRPVVAPAAAALQRLDLRKARFPETQHMLWQLEVFRHLADRPECVRPLVHNRPLLTCGTTCPSGPATPAARKATRSRRGGFDYSSPSLRWPLMRARNTFEGLNTMTRRGSIGTSTPVFGLRPMRCPLSRTTKEPNEDSFTVSPFARQLQISESTISTRDADSVRDSPTF